MPLERRDTIDLSQDSDDGDDFDLSQTTPPPSSQAPAGSDDVLELTDSDGETGIASSSQGEGVHDLSDEEIEILSPKKTFSAKGKGKARAHSNYDSDSDSELIDPSRLASLVKHDISRKASSSSTIPKTSASSKRRYSQSSVPNDCPDSDATPSPPKKSRPSTSSTSASAKTTTKRKKKTAEDRENEKEQKEWEKLKKKEETQKKKEEAQKKKDDTNEQKERGKLEKKRQKDADTAQKNKEKEYKALFKAANKLRIDKKETIKEMTIIFSQSTPDELINRFEDKVREHKATIEREPSLLPGYESVRWRRLVDREYDTKARCWLPVQPPYPKYETSALLRLSVRQLRELVKSPNENAFRELVQTFRATHGLPADMHQGQVVLLINGMEKLRKRSAAEWRGFHDALTRLQFNEHVHYIEVNDSQEAADRLYNITGDLGIKWDKLVSRTHLPFCSDVRQEKGKSYAETYRKMLDQIHRVTDSHAAGIVQKYPSMRSLMMAYEGEPNEALRESLLIGTTVSHRNDGHLRTGDKSGQMGKILSKRVHTVLFGDDHLEIVAKD